MDIFPEAPVAIVWTCAWHARWSLWPISLHMALGVPMIDLERAALDSPSSREAMLIAKRDREPATKAQRTVTTRKTVPWQPGTQLALDVEDKDGRTYMLRFRGASIAQRNDIEVFVSAGEQVLVYDAAKRDYRITRDPAAELRSLLDQPGYIDALSVLGLTPEVDLVGG